MVTTPEARMKHWQRCIRDQPKWPFHVPTRCTDPRDIKALAEHLQHVHGVGPAYLTGWYPSIYTWEQLLARHQHHHDRNGWDTHGHADIPNVSWP